MEIQIKYLQDQEQENTKTLLEQTNKTDSLLATIEK